MTVPEICDSLMNGSVYVRLKSLMYWPNCQFSEPCLQRPNRFGWSKPMKPPTPAPCPTDAPKFTLPGALLLHAEDDVDVALVVRRLRVRRRQRRLEEAEVADALVAADQRVAAEHVARHDEDLVPDARLRRDVVAERSRRGSRSPAVVSSTSQRRFTVGTESGPTFDALDDRAHVRVDVALVRVRLADATRRVVPRATGRSSRRRRCRGPRAASALHRAGERRRLLAERIEAREVLAGEVPAARHLEGADPVARPFVHRDVDERLAALAVDAASCPSAPARR